MKSCFNSSAIITQFFGNEFIWNDGKPYYVRYGLDGHNGIDLKPSDKYKDIYNILLGEIVVFEFNKCYGNRVGIWNRDLNLFECHNHLEYLPKYLHVGKELSKAEILGKMGVTGMTTGSHNHYALANVNKQCRRINIDNGFQGWIDPLPFLEGKL